MGTTDDRGLTFEYHAEQDRRGTLIPERGRRPNFTVATPAVNGNVTVTAVPPPDPNQGILIGLTAVLDALGSGTFNQVLSVGILGANLTVEYGTIGDNQVLWGSRGSLTGINVDLSRYVGRATRFAFGLRSADANRHWLLWANGVLIGRGSVPSVPQSDFGGADVFVANDPAFRIVSPNVRLYYGDPPPVGAGGGRGV